MSENITKAILKTSEGDVTISFLKNKAPKTCENFINLAKDGFYNGITFHRIIRDFMIQGGCPTGTGTGGPGYTINAEFNDTKHVPGVVSMARSMDPNSAGSQFFICVGATPHLDGQYTAFANVTEGYEIVQKISTVQTDPSDKPLSPVIIESVVLS